MKVTHEGLEAAQRRIANTPIIDRAEHERLKQAVVEAAKLWRKQDIKTPWIILDDNLAVKVDALNAFEAEHVKGGE